MTDMSRYLYWKRDMFTLACPFILPRRKWGPVTEIKKSIRLWIRHMGKVAAISIYLRSVASSCDVGLKSCWLLKMVVHEIRHRSVSTNTGTSIDSKEMLDETSIFELTWIRRKGIRFESLPLKIQMGSQYHESCQESTMRYQSIRSLYQY